MSDLFEEWLESLEKKRLTTGANALSFKFVKRRVRRIQGPENFPKGAFSILYWMCRDQRVQDNWAFLYAQRLALKFEVPLYVCFCIAPVYQSDTFRQFNFMVRGLAEVEKECLKLNIPFYLLNAADYFTESSPDFKTGWQERWRLPHLTDSSQAFSRYLYADEVSRAISALVTQLRIGCLVTDQCPLRTPIAWLNATVAALPEDVPICQVDAHNIVPVWCGSEKEEFTARTIRPKLYAQTSMFLTEFPLLIKHPYPDYSTGIREAIDWEAVLSSYGGDCNVPKVHWVQPGTRSGLEVLRKFIDKRLKHFDQRRNNPLHPALSGLSPWFHFGQVSPQRAVLEVQMLRKEFGRNAEIFIEEAFNRRELADNFCYHNCNYDSLMGARRWAQDTLEHHADDPRDVAYTLDQLEQGKTADDLWNVAQSQLLDSGKMHGFLRQYWAKKILEWCAAGPKTAVQWAIYLNDRYSLDATDPNGYVGILWAICGIHDQGWAERPIFGKVRYMTYNGCKKWFSIDSFVTKHLEGTKN